MKFLRPILFLASLLLAALFVVLNPTPAVALFACLSVWCIGNALGTPRAARLCVTLSVNEILQDTLDAFKALVPMLNAFSTDFSSATARKDDQIIAHIRSLPSVQDYDATTGYKANAAEADSLLTDVPVTLSRLKHVPVKVDYLTQLASKKNLYREAIADQAYVLGKSIVDYALSLVTDLNCTKETVRTIGNSNFDATEEIRTQLNIQRALNGGRFGLVNSQVAQTLQGDTRIASKDFYGQLNGGGGYRHFRGVSGFDNIWEYPDFPANGISLSGFFGDRRAVTVATRLPSVQSEIAEVLGLPSIAKFATVSDAESGLSLLGIYWQEPGTFDVYMTVAILYGASVGTRGGAAESSTDLACHKLVEN